MRPLGRVQPQFVYSSLARSVLDKSHQLVADTVPLVVGVYRELAEVSNAWPVIPWRAVCCLGTIQSSGCDQLPIVRLSNEAQTPSYPLERDSLLLGGGDIVEP